VDATVGHGLLPREKHTLRDAWPISCLDLALDPSRAILEGVVRNFSSKVQHRFVSDPGVGGASHKGQDVLM